MIGQEFVSVPIITDALRRKYRQSLPGIMWKAISAVENALWDLKSKVDEIPLSEYFDIFTTKQPVYKAYWSHCPTTRVRASEFISGQAVRTELDLINLGKLINDNGFSTIKTNLVSLTPDPKIYMPGFNKNFSFEKQKIPTNYAYELNKILSSISLHNPNLEYIIDFNFNLKYEDFVEIQEMFSGKNIRYFEIDFDDHETKELFLENALMPICTGENILGLWNYMPIIEDKRVSVISIDLLWNGLTESLKIAHAAITQGKKIALHNYYGSLATSMALTFMSFLPTESLDLLEFDFDDVPWRDEITTKPASFENGFLVGSLGLGWNNELILEAVSKYNLN